jgi:alkylation response protein AidB-like acyl-CoA dehydrogenase
MDFTFTAEQEMLRDSLGKLLAQGYTFEQRKAIVRGDHAHSALIWNQLGEMGLLALPFAEHAGGLGGSASDLVAISELLGRHLVVEPYAGSIVLGGGALALGGDAVRPLLDAVIAGTTLVALAHEERHGIGAPGLLQTTLHDTAGTLRLTGEKRLVLAGAEAEALIVSARAGDRLALVRVDPSTSGVTIADYTTIDGRRAAAVRFADVAVAPTDVLCADATEPLQQIIATATLALCAEAVGAMAALLEMTSTYAATRKQFGTPIGAFQVIAHRLADMKIAYAKAHALLLYTTALAETGAAAARDIALLKVQAGRLGRSIGESAVQIHGGIGMTDELPVGHYLKRILAVETMLGSTEYHLRLIGSSGQ